MLATVVPCEAGLPLQVMGSLVFVVGVHFVALAAVFGEPFFRWLGGAITVCGLAGLALAAAGAQNSTSS